MTSTTTSTHVLIESGPDCGRLVSVARGVFTVGRSRAATVPVDDPRLEPQHLVRTVNLGMDRSARLADTTIRLVDGVTEPSASPRTFHRPPVALRPGPSAPVAPSISELQPSPPSTPSPAMFLTTTVSAFVLAMATGQSSLFVMSVVGSGVMATMWAGGRFRWWVRRRRHARRVNNESAAFHEDVRAYSSALAATRRAEHPTIGELLLMAHRGDSALWSRRDVGRVALGRETREIEPVRGASKVTITDVPFTVSLASGEVLGIHGFRAFDVLRAVIARLSVLVGPADWQLLVCRSEAFDCVLPSLRFAPIDRLDVDLEVDHRRHRLLVVDDPGLLASRSAPARRLLAQGESSMIVIAPDTRSLPAFCTRIIDSQDPLIDGVSAEGLDQFAVALAQWIDPEAAPVLPGRVDFNQSHSDRPAGTSGALEVRIGEAMDGHMDVDLVADGPHVLVVGTTGSGKSELLRTMVASLAHAYAPTSVNFVLLDYKGGAAFDGLVALPHVVGIVTDLDDNDADRVMRGLEAELRRREVLLRDGGVVSVDVAERLGLAEYPPRLVIVVDELATLVRDRPRFVEALVAIAQRGRSLGIHLVLGTQRAAGVVSEAIAANCNLRIAMRTQSAADSMDVIGSPRAVHIGRDAPGRAVVRLGHDELVDVQAAYLGDDDLDVMCHRWPSVAMHRPWLDVLPPVVDAVEARLDEVGVIDDPDHQCRRQLVVGPSENVVMCGPAGESFENMVNALIRSTAHAMRLDYSHPERLWRQLNFMEDHETMVVVDGLDVWRRLHTDSRFAIEQYSRFEQFVHAGRCRLIARVAGDFDVPSSLVSRVQHVWHTDCVDSPWRVRCGDRVLAARPLRCAMPSWLEVELLPNHIDDLAPELVGRFAHTLEPMNVRDLIDSDGRLVFCVIGPRGSGRTTTVNAVMRGWHHGFPDRALTVVDGDRELSHLAVVPEGDVIFACTPGFLRSRSDHWVNLFRRQRCGVLLGSAARDDLDLLGVYSLDPHPFGPLPGRGLLVIGGEVVDHVHWASCASSFPPEPRPRSNVSPEPPADSSSSPTSSDSGPFSMTS